MIRLLHLSDLHFDLATPSHHQYRIAARVNGPHYMSQVTGTTMVDAILNALQRDNEGFIRTFGDQASILNYLQSVSAMLKIAPKSLT
jgi:hypothetical protein